MLRSIRLVYPIEIGQTEKGVGFHRRAFDFELLGALIRVEADTLGLVFGGGRKGVRKLTDSTKGELDFAIEERGELRCSGLLLWKWE